MPAGDRSLRFCVRLPGLLVSLGLILTLPAGCASDALRPFAKKEKKPEPGPQVAAPVERMKAMDELVKKAPKMSPAEHEKESLALAKAIQREEDPLIRLQIVRTLAVFPTKVAGDVLTAAAKDTDSDVRIACCHSWGTRKGPDAVKVLGGLLNSDTDLDVRIAAARALGETRDTSAIESLGQALEDKDPAMQHRAIVSLEKITGKHLGTDAEAWRAFVRGDNPPEESLASRVKRWF